MEAFKVHHSISYGGELGAGYTIGGYVITTQFCILSHIIEWELHFGRQ